MSFIDPVLPVSVIRGFSGMQGCILLLFGCQQMCLDYTNKMIISKQWQTRMLGTVVSLNDCIKSLACQYHQIGSAGSDGAFCRSLTASTCALIAQTRWGSVDRTKKAPRCYRRAVWQRKGSMATEGQHRTRYHAVQCIPCNTHDSSVL